MDEFNRAREAIVQHLRRKGFSCEQAHAKIMRFQSETQIAYREFKNTGFTDGGFQFTMEDDDMPPPPPPLASTADQEPPPPPPIQAT